MKTILLFRTSASRTNRFDYKSAYDFAARHDWRVQIVEYINAAVSRWWQDAPAPRPDVKALLALWKPDGCIVECGGIPYEPWLDEFKGVPTVYLDRPLLRDDPNAVCVASDPEAVASAAAKELLSLGLNDFAYAKWYAPLPWSEERGKLFADIVRRHGKRCGVFTVDKQLSLGGDIRELAATLRQLPKPCGVFAANDETAAAIIIACCKAGIDVPNDVAVVGVDNDVEICESLPVTLTSIEQDFTDTGRLAAELLERMMTHGDADIGSRTFGVRRLVRRASAIGVRNVDKRIAAAIEFVRKEFYKPLVPADVAAKMGCSMRHAHRMFLNARKHTILDEIHLRRIETAKEQLLARASSVESIAELCGYASSTDFSRVFRRYVGLSPKEWQKRQCTR